MDIQILRQSSWNLKLYVQEKIQIIFDDRTVFQLFTITINYSGKQFITTMLPDNNQSNRSVTCKEKGKLLRVCRHSTFVVADTTIALYCILYKRFYNVLIAFESHGLVGKRFCFHCTKTKQFDSLLHLPLCTEEFAADFCLVGLKDCSHVSRMVSF